MSYPPPRPPLGMPGMPPMGPLMAPYTIQGMSALGPMAMGMLPTQMMAMSVPMTMPLTTMRPVIKSAPPTTYKKQAEPQVEVSKGPTVTVFVGNISETLSDNLLRQILQKCGTVIYWKRVQGANGKLQAFGFCEYGDPETAMKAIRILHEWEMGGKRLVVKVDAKTKGSLDEYVANKKSSEKFNEAALKKEDEATKNFIIELLRSCSDELCESPTDSDSYKNSKLEYEAYESINVRDDLDEMGLEEDRKNLIHREIDKFRDTYKAICKLQLPNVGFDLI